MLARQPCIPFEAFAEPVLAAEALLVAAVGALGPCQGEEYQIAHLCRRVPVPSRAGLRGCPPTGGCFAAQRQVLGRSGCVGRVRRDSPRAVAPCDGQQAA